MPDKFRFELIARDGRARRGRIHTPHGVIDTPAFMPVGTAGALKALTPLQVAETGAQIVLANTYHLLLRPGPEVVARLGGLHGFMRWERPILTDSGGFQVFSLADLNRIDDDGVTFRSHLDGALVHLTPERSMQVQNLLGADVIMAFDQCPALPASAADLRVALERTVAWAARCRAAHARPDQALYGIVQGGLDLDLRRECLERLVEIGFDGYAIGGLSVGEPPAAMWTLLDRFAHELPEDRPRYLMGVGTPRDLIEAVAAGVDQFDCVLPTRNGRKGYAFTRQGVVRLRNAAHREDASPLEAGCDCYACAGGFARGYLRHLIQAGEQLGGTLVSLHNVRFYQRLMAALRTAIAAGELDAWRRTALADWGAAGDDSDHQGADAPAARHTEGMAGND